MGDFTQNFKILSETYMHKKGSDNGFPGTGKHYIFMIPEMQNMKTISTRSSEWHGLLSKAFAIFAGYVITLMALISVIRLFW